VHKYPVNEEIIHICGGMEVLNMLIEKLREFSKPNSVTY